MSSDPCSAAAPAGRGDRGGAAMRRDTGPQGSAEAPRGTCVPADRLLYAQPLMAPENDESDR
jgi:hypothetical protein